MKKIISYIYKKCWDIIANPTMGSSPRSRHAVKFLSWNINHSRDKIEGAKVDIPEIQKLFNNHDILALQETKGVVNLSNYLCFNSNRKGSNSGGVCIGVHKSLKDGVINVPVTSSDDIIAIKMKASFFDLDKDTYLINVYDSPINGSYKKRQKTKLGDEDVSTLDYLQEFLASIPLSEDAILLGDFNARTSTLQDMLSDTTHLQDAHLNDYFARSLPIRSNSDHKLNPNGKPFIELLQTTGLIILNGRTLGDIFGEPTCIQRQGVSTVDYICVSTSLYDRVQHFQVNGISQYSDHRSLSMSISTNPIKRLSGDIELANIVDAPKPYKWIKSDNVDKDTSTRFQLAQNSQIHVDKVKSLLLRPTNSVSEVVQLNADVVSLYQDLAESVTVKKSGKRPNRKKWFDNSCRASKRDACRVDRNANNNPHSTFLREQHFLKKKEYRSVKKKKKGQFLYDMNNKINGDGALNWSALKQLSETHKDEDPFDIYDLLLFQKFFSDLYNRKCCKDHTAALGNCNNEDNCDDDSELLSALNDDFTIEEIREAIRKLQNNKSVAEDLICNEMLKSSNQQLQQILQKLFNSSLKQGIYPWNGSLTTPLHKKGDRANPDNYRAITVGSCLGKLFSSLLLKRLMSFREAACPDLPYQLGFRSGAQCNDHILTLSTIIEKYVVKEKKRIFACFVDYKKAFDSVCRDALLYKLSTMGIKGNFFRCISHMYRNSSTRIKLIQKLSAAIDVTIGTEQGHPMSPELFKIFIHELSANLAGIEELNAPLLNGLTVSHLLWADDLVLLALDAESLQKLLDCLSKYAEDWELSVNISKTNVMVFNSSSRILKCAHGFKLGNLNVKPARNYCYLGIQFSLNGSFKQAVEELRKKALRSYFSIRRMIDTRALTTSTLLKLIDSLVKPVATYGCPIWLPSTTLIKTLVAQDSSKTLPKAAAKDQLETTHLKMLKWILGVHRKANNNFCYGDTGRMPLAISVLPQCISYFMRAAQATDGNVNTLLHHTFQEQKQLKLSWYKTWSHIVDESCIAKPNLPPSAAARSHFAETFIAHWREELLHQPKMSFYSTTKLDFHEEPYLQMQSKSHRQSIAKLRSSSHDLRVETGRYRKNQSQSPPSKTDRACRFCHSIDNIYWLEQLPFFEEPILENEVHVVTECPGYHNIRLTLSDNLKSLIMLKAFSTIMTSHHAAEFGKYLTDSQRLRNLSMN